MSLDACVRSIHTRIVHYLIQPMVLLRVGLPTDVKHANLRARWIPSILRQAKHPISDIHQIYEELVDPAFVLVMH